MIGRRALLGVLAGAPVAGPSLVKKALAAKAAAAGVTAADVFGDGPTTGVSPAVDPVWDLREAFYHKHSARRDNRRYGFPVHIDAKRSWSPAFKQHVADEEQAAVDAFMKRLEEDRTFAQQMLRVFGVA